MVGSFEKLVLISTVVISMIHFDSCDSMIPVCCSFKAETHDATNRGDTSRRQVASSALLLRRVACA